MPRILYFLSGGCGDPYYRIEIATDTSGLVKTHIATNSVAEDDLRQILSQRITVSCHREPDKSGPGCSHFVTGISWNGRELVKR